MQYERISLGSDNQPNTPPYLDCYLLDTPVENARMICRPAVLICPGGGYGGVSKREGEPVAMRFLAAGFHAFVLEYSVAPARFPTALLQAAAAVKMVRENAAAWKVNPSRIYCMGFSAGGHLCASLGTLWNHPLLAQSLGTTSKTKPWKPDGMLLCYPVLTMGAHTHQGSLQNLLGENPAEDLVHMLSLETQVDENTVPAFLWHTEDDGAVPVENTLLFATALRKAGISFELHIYQHGPHGISLCDQTTAYEKSQIVPDAAGWVNLAVAWINRQ